MTDAAIAPRRPWAYAVFLVIAGAAGWWASFQLMIDDIAVLKDPNAGLNCNISVLVQCGRNLVSEQGSAFGFPNPILGLGGFAAVIAVGVALLAGARFANWFWWLFNLGVAGALAFIIWLIYQTIYVLGTLCPWCMLVYLVMFPLFWLVTLRNAAQGAFGSGLVRFGRIVLPYAVPIAVVCLLVVAVLAQVHLNALQRL